MFCSTLRRRPSLTKVIPIVIARNGLNLQENLLETHDLAIPSEQGGNLLVLIITPGSVAEDRLPATLERVRRFATLNGGANSIILYLLEPLHQTLPAYTTYPGRFTRVLPLLSPQPSPNSTYSRFKEALDDNSISAPQVLPAPSNASVPQILKAFARGTQTTLPANSNGSINMALDILPLVTASNRPLDADVVVALTDMFPSLRNLANATTDEEQSQGILAQMGQALGEQTAQDVADFWREEWIAE